YPCNHCTRRRRPEECVFGSPPAPASSSSSSHRQLDVLAPTATTAPTAPMALTCPTDDLRSSSRPPDNKHSALAESFGYFEHSNTNTMALLRNWDLSDVGTMVRDQSMSPSIFEKVKRDFERMPQRGVLDFLVQYHVRELNWMKHIIHGTTFLYRYQKWWISNDPLSVADVEFAVLILRICAYAAQFLPSPTNRVETVSGISLNDIRRICSDVADSLADTCALLDPKGSLVRVQHIMYASLKASCEGRTDQFWDGIVSACRAALKAGIHTDATVPGYYGAQKLEQELNRRTFCSLYVLDSHLSRQLDRFPILPNDLVANTIPRMRLAPDLGEMHPDPNAPEPFTERLMQVQLGRFWRSQTREPYDPTQAEQRYEKFVAEYLPTLPPAFALQPDTKWDSHLPKLTMQRQLLHIAIFDSVCWNFRPLLLLPPDHVANLPAYKRVLLRSQKRRMCLAALKELEAVSTLHSLFGGSQTRFAAIIFNSFEAAIALLCLCTHPDCPFDLGEDDNEILGLKVPGLTQSRMLEAAEEALARLRSLAEGSEMAAAGAQIIAQMTAQLSVKGVSPKPDQSSSSLGPSTPTSATSLRTSAWSMCANPSAVLGDEAGFWASLEGCDVGTGPMTGSTAAPTTVVPEDFNSYFGLQLHNAGFFMP
ncbi:hypothetical protein C8A03DRAFT_17836, partial [Achaetomium macrosporum]